jgi:hypothetical protein
MARRTARISAPRCSASAQLTEYAAPLAASATSSRVSMSSVHSVSAEMDAVRGIAVTSAASSNDLPGSITVACAWQSTA